jgi:DGQHR domain-containing protein
METTFYDCIKVQQRQDVEAPECLLFSAPVQEIISWAAIDRFCDSSQTGPQRVEKPYKVKAVQSFFLADKRNTIPTAIVIGLRPGKFLLTHQSAECQRVHELKIEFQRSAKPQDLPGIIIDGQHRVLGLMKFNPQSKVNVIALLNADDTETAFQFLVINNKASKVASDHIRALALHYEKEELDERLKKVRLNLDSNLRFVGFANSADDSPFRGLLAMPSNPADKQLVAPAAIEEAMGYLRQQKIQELQDDEFSLSLFFGIWRILKEKWPHLWENNSKLLQKVSVVCTTQFFMDNLLRKYDWNELDIYDTDKVESEIHNIVEKLNSQFWEQSTEWIVKGLDTQAGKKILLEALAQIVRNTRQESPWYADIDMIRCSAISYQ